jgi:hypothetical protein
MDAKRKAASSVKVGTTEETASRNLPNITHNILKNQHTTQTTRHYHMALLWVAPIIWRLTCWEMLLAALAVLFRGGLTHG